MRLDAREAERRILGGGAPANLVVEGRLDFCGLSSALTLPRGLTVFGDLVLDRSGIEALPDGLTVHGGSLTARGCSRLAVIGSKLRAPKIDLSGCDRLHSIPHAIKARYGVTIDDCHALERTAELESHQVSLARCSALRQTGAIRAANLDVRGCLQLRSLAGGSRVERLKVDRWTALPFRPEFVVDGATARHWISLGRARGGLRVAESLDLRNCIEVASLPDPLSVEGELLLEGCTSLRSLPEGLTVTGRLDLLGIDPRVQIPKALRARSVRLASGEEIPGRTPGPGALAMALQVPGLALGAARFFWSTRGGTSSAEPGVAPAEALRRLRAGHARPLIVDDRLEVSDLPQLTELPGGLHARGDLVLKKLPRLARLPDDLRVEGRLTIVDCPSLTSLPPRLSCLALSLSRCPTLTALPEGLACSSVTLEECDAVEDLSALDVRGLAVIRCSRVTRAPAAFRGHSLALRDLPALTALPRVILASSQVELAKLPLVDSLPARFQFARAVLFDLPRVTSVPGPLEGVHLTLEALPGIVDLPPLRLSHGIALRGCSGLRVVGESVESPEVEVRGVPLEDFRTRFRTLRRLSLAGCARLRELPADLTTLEDLDVSGCRSLRALPERLRVRGSLNIENCRSLEALPPQMPAPARLELGGSVLSRLPTGWERVPTTWHRLAIEPSRLFLEPAELAASLFAEPNVEIRRALLEKLGLERLVAVANAEVLDSDRDPGGPRELLRIEAGDREPIVALRVTCPSTRRTFVLRVPPTQRSCRSAAAWLAGYTNAADYNPQIET